MWGPQNAPTGCSLRLEAGRDTASERCRSVCAGACLSKTVFGVGLCRMRDDRYYPDAPRRPLRRRLGLRFHRETGRILCGLLAIDSVSMLTPLQPQCPPLVFSAAPMPINMPQCMPAVRRFCRHRPNQQASLRAWSYLVGRGIKRYSRTFLRVWGYPLQRGEAQLHRWS